jgi:hypothetical protein
MHRRDFGKSLSRRAVAMAVDEAGSIDFDAVQRQAEQPSVAKDCLERLVIIKHRKTASFRWRI